MEILFCLDFFSFWLDMWPIDLFIPDHFAQHALSSRIYTVCFAVGMVQIKVFSFFRSYNSSMPSTLPIFRLGQYWILGKLSIRALQRGGACYFYPVTTATSTPVTHRIKQ